MIIPLILLFIFVLAVIVQLYYYGIIFSKLSGYKGKTASKNELPISVIICAKNEAKNLKALIPLLVEQDYPKFEIVLINDSSYDKTLKVMNKAKETYDNIKIVDVKEVDRFKSHKKYALTLGIKAASYDYLLFTDADCKPNSKHWISTMANQFSNNKHIVLGYGKYEKRKGSLLNALIRFETLLAATQYLSYALNNNPYMGVGRNMAYKKDLFFENNGFFNHMDVMSGDDDLLINSIATSTNTTISIEPDSFTTSIPANGLGKWIQQKRRHITTASYYKKGHKMTLAMFYISNITFLAIGATLLILWHQPILVATLILFRYLFQIITLGKIANKLEEKDIILLFPLLEILLVIVQFNIFIMNLISKPKRWS